MMGGKMQGREDLRAGTKEIQLRFCVWCVCVLFVHVYVLLWTVLPERHIRVCLR